MHGEGTRAFRLRQTAGVVVGLLTCMSVGWGGFGGATPFTLKAMTQRFLAGRSGASVPGMVSDYPGSTHLGSVARPLVNPTCLVLAPRAALWRREEVGGELHRASCADGTYRCAGSRDPLRLFARSFVSAVAAATKLAGQRLSTYGSVDGESEAMIGHWPLCSLADPSVR